MVLRCSLLGHDYGDPDIEREREERGSEVVVTVQEYEECTRCGDRNVISENTEVTSLSMADDSLESPSTADQPAEPANARTDSSIDSTPDEGTDAVFIDNDAAAPDDETNGGEAGESDTSAETAETPAADAEGADTDGDYPTDENGEPITDDGEILEDTPDDEPDSPRERNRERGEWPDTDDVGPPVGAENDSTAWPDSDNEPVDDDAVVLENDSSTLEDADASEADMDTDADPASATETPPTRLPMTSRCQLVILPQGARALQSLVETQSPQHSRLSPTQRP